MFSNAVRVDPGFAPARRNLGAALLKQGRVEAGLAQLKAGTALEPDNVDASRKMAEALVEHGKATEAATYCEMVVKARPRDAHARYMLGEIWLAQKHYEEAAANLKEAMRLAPKVPQVINALAWIYATCPEPAVRNGAEAVRLAEHACQLSERRSVEYSRHTRSGVAQRQGDFRMRSKPPRKPVRLRKRPKTGRRLKSNVNGSSYITRARRITKHHELEIKNEEQWRFYGLGRSLKSRRISSMRRR